MIRREDQKGDTVTFNHTMAGTITSRDYRTKANSPSGTIADSDTFTFDNLGRMLTAVSGRYTNTVTMTYDSYGRLKDESLTLASQTYTVTRAYDTRSRLTQLTYPNGSIVQRTYTTRSQLHTVKYLGTTVDTRTYDDGGRLGTSTYANAAVVSFAYRNDNLPTSIATTHAGSPNIGTYSYTWDANKNKTGETITSTMSGFGFSTGATGYDDEDRLQTWNRTNGTMNQAWTLSDVGNWDAFTSAGSTWNRTHSNAHEFTGFTGASTGTLAYDVKGNQTSRPSTLSAPALNLDWNFDNQLVGADTNGSAGSLEVTFEYDALGRRVSRSHSSGNVVYVHAGQQVIADYARGTAAASPSYRYVYADYVDEPILRHTGTGTTLPTTGDNALYFHRNQQYSIIGLTNAAGTLVERYSYTAYGTLGIYDASGTVRTTSTYANRYTYTGREWDPDLNLYHFRARWYDPSTGGFISRDPLGYVDGMSLYRGYFGVTFLDPTGTIEVFFHGHRGMSGPSSDSSGGSSGSSDSGTGSSDAGGSSASGSSEHGGSSDSGPGSSDSNSSRPNSSKNQAYPLYRWADRHFSWSETDAAVEYVISMVGQPDAQCEPIVLVGHSFGGWAAMETAKKLKEKGYTVDLLATLDPVTSAGHALTLGTKEEKKPTGVKLHWNWYQTETHPHGASVTDADLNIKNQTGIVDGKDQILNHTKIDDDRPISDKIKERSEQIHQQWAKPECCTE